MRCCSRQAALQAQEEELKRQILAAKGQPSDDKQQQQEAEKQSKLAPEGEYAIARTREKYAAKARVDKKTREKAALAKFSAFSSKLRTTKLEATPAKQEEDYCRM
jgi:hypothetical protein